MSVSEFYRMRALRKDGRIVLVLKIRLPKLLPGEGVSCEAAERFSLFYSSLSDAVERAFSESGYTSDGGTRHGSVTVDYEVKNHTKTKGEMLEVTRWLKVKLHDEVKKISYRDAFDITN